MLLVHVHDGAAVSRRRITGHLMVMMVRIVHQIGDGYRDGHVASVMVVAVLRVNQVVMMRMNQMVQRIAADRVGGDGAT